MDIQFITSTSIWKQDGSHCMYLINVQTPWSYAYTLKRKRNATLSKNGSSFFFTKKSANDNEIAKYRYLPCIQHQNQTALTYGW